MTDSAFADKLDAVLSRLRLAEARLEQDEVDDLKDLQADVAALCAGAERLGADARAGLRAAMDGLDALEAKMRARHEAVETKLRSNPDRKRALAAYGRP